MITGFNHSGFVIRDLEKALAFYRDILGFKVIREVGPTPPREADPVGVQNAQRLIIFVGQNADQHQLELEHYIDPTSPEGHVPVYALGAAHVCFDVDDLQATYQELTDKGVPFITPPVTIPSDPGTSYRMCCAWDPEGNRLEFREFKVLPT